INSGRTAAAFSCSSLGYYRIHSHVKNRGLKCGSVGATFVSEAKRNPDFSWQNKNRLSRSRNRSNEGRDGFENFEEDMLSSKNGPLVSLSTSGKYQATAAPGPREKVIDEHFRKIEAELHERAAIKEEKKVEASRGQGQGKENSAVDSLLKLFKKHSVEQVKRSSGGGRGKKICLDQLQESNQFNGERSTKFSDLGSAPKDESLEANISSVDRPRSNFQRWSPVPRAKYQPIFNNEDDSEPDPFELLFPEIAESRTDMWIPKLSEDDSHDSELSYNDESVEEQLVVQHEDLSALKLPELRALAKSRGLKGLSKMKKGELGEFLSELILIE
ncbi:rho-N domain-containing protein 1, chloroplastic-like, partial [Gastrolobium bilobum]|uniref:rho-N domain-containing protein 1, chloroplastic-like n=1 Tax=Gastrolobium bilobum TaxID=150636 RepID=UPI002AB25985